MYNHRPLIPFLIGLLGLLGTLITRADEFLLPDQAFRISATAEGANAVQVSWDIEPGYYLYRNKLRFRGESPGIKVGAPTLPPGQIKQDEFFGEVEIYRGHLTLRVPLERNPGAGQTLTLEATSQGCADAGLCYPPHKQLLQVALPPLADGAPSASEPGGRSLRHSLAAIGEQLSRSSALDEILEPEQAFRVDASVEGPDGVRLIWTIAPGTYLYRDQLRISLEGPPSVALGPYQLPPAEIKPDSVRPNGGIGEVALYHDLIDLRLPLVRSDPNPTPVTLRVAYQGCAERGICYPPITQTLSLDLPAAVGLSGPSGSTPEAKPSSPAATPATSEAPSSEQDQIATTLRQGNTWIILATFFGFGLLLALTPCVFPMIPILSGIIAGHGTSLSTRRAFLLSLVYVLAMAFAYTLAGVLAGLFGANLQAAFQHPWILIGFAGVFVLLALSMFGFYDLQLPSGLQGKLSAFSNRQQGGQFLGVAIMGLLSALIVGPCIAPPLAGALLYISQTGDALLGGIALFTLSLGMGTPLILIGTSAGKLLPRAGTWMEAIKEVFGVLMLGVAILLLERILPPAVALLLWGLLLICSGVNLGAMQSLPQDTSGWRRLWQGLGFALLVYGSLMLLGAAAGGRDTLQPLRGLTFSGTAGTHAELQFRRIKTTADLDRELAAAKRAQQPLMLDFYADWCVSCKEMERYTFSSPEVMGALSNFVLLQADVTANDAADRALMQGRFGIPGPPAILFFGADGVEKPALRVVGFMPAVQFAAQVKRARG